MTSQVQPKTAFLDTNTLLKLFSFWEACQVVVMRLDSVHSWEDLRTALITTTTPTAQALEATDFAIVSEGLRCFQSINQAKLSYDFFSCNVCHSEMHRTILESTATDRLIRARIPFSLRNSRPLLVHQHVLQNADYKMITEQRREFFSSLQQDYHIDIRMLDDPVHGPLVRPEDILITAEALWSRVLIETMDAYIYAAAIECEADYLLTSDRPLRQIAHNLRRPSEEWITVAQDLREVLGKSEDFTFPANYRPTIQLPV